MVVFVSIYQYKLVQCTSIGLHLLFQFALISYSIVLEVGIVVLWVGCRTCNHEVAGLTLARMWRVLTPGKLFTPLCPCHQVV